MKRLLLINPNTSPGMTAVARDVAAAHLPEGVELETVTAAFGFPVVATRLSYAVAAYAALDAYATSEARHDAVLLACFGDPGLEALRELSPVPVVGFAEASIRAAQSRREPFAIVTIGKAWMAMLEERVALAQATDGFLGVYALDGAGLDALNSPDATLAGLERLVRQAAAAGARTIVLGGVALAGWAPRLPAEAHYIDCVQAAIAEACAPVAPQARRSITQPGPARGLTSKLGERLAGPAPQ
jgi:Asp/Glu/hydantoin racemase